MLGEKRNKVVYLHKDENNIVFYVGIGYKQRAFTSNKRHKLWYKHVKNNKFKVFIVNSNLSPEDAYEIERELILAFGRKGLEKGGTLVNRVIDVGCHFQNRKHKPETILKMSESAKNRKSHNKKCYWKGRIYKSIRECSRQEKIPFSTVQKYLYWNKIKDCYVL